MVNNFFFLRDLRLYRETPQGGFSSHWSVAVGPTIQQWTSFIASLGRAGEEAELCHFLKKDLFSYVQDCIESPYMNDFADELNSARLLDKEAAELAEIRQQRGLPVAPTPLPQVKSLASPSSQVCVPLATEGGSGSSAASSSGNSTSTCPLTPPNEVPSALPCVSQASQPAASTPESSAAPVKASLTAPNTPCNLFFNLFCSSLPRNYCSINPLDVNCVVDSVSCLSTFRLLFFATPQWHSRSAA